MKNNVRPWLRFFEGTEGNQAGGDGGQQNQGGTNDQGGAGDAGKNTGGDQSKGGTGDGNEDAAKQRLIRAVQEQAKASEPAPKDKPGEKADAPKLEDLLQRLDAQQKTIDALKESDSKAVQEKRAALAVEVAKAARLPEAMAARLTGDTKEQMESDAKELAKAFGSLVVDPGQGQGGGKSTTMTMDQAVAAKIAAAGLK